MNSKKRPFSNLKSENWRNLLFFAIICLYFFNFLPSFVHGALGDDFFAFWSAGKIADEKGYSEIYSLNNLRIVQMQVMKNLGFVEKTDNLSFSPTPVPYFSFFIAPFQFISRISVIEGYRIWTFLNLVLLTGYLFFFLRRIDSRNSIHVSNLKLIIPFLSSYPVFINMSCGQVEVFLLICAGEFLRNAVNKKSIISGLWLGGLLLKPQLLILIIPIFIIMGNWKALAGFFASSVLILGTSLLLSGLYGLQALINLWTKYSAGLATNAPEWMINWRMVGVNLNYLLSTSLGWIITGLGMVLTILVVFYLTRHIPPYGSPLWVMSMLGIFSATLALTWHSHYHMAMVLIPFLVYALVNKLLPEKRIFMWCVVTSMVYFVIIILRMLFIGLIRIDISVFQMIAIAFSGLIINLMVVYSVMQSTSIISEIPAEKSISV